MRETDRETDAERKTDREGDRQTDRQIKRQTDRDRERITSLCVKYQASIYFFKVNNRNTRTICKFIQS